jgi:hypothetical protein
MDQLKTVPDPSHRDPIEVLHAFINKEYLKNYVNLSKFNQSHIRTAVFNRIYDLYKAQHSAGYYAYAARIDEYRLRIGAWLYYAPLEKALGKDQFTEPQRKLWEEVLLPLCKKFVRALLQKTPESIDYIYRALDNSEQVLQAFSNGLYDSNAYSIFNHWFMAAICEHKPQGKDVSLIMKEYQDRLKPTAHVRAAAPTPDPYSTALRILDQQIAGLVKEPYANNEQFKTMWQRVFRGACIHFLQSVLGTDATAVDAALMDIMFKLHAMYGASSTPFKSIIVGWVRALLQQYGERYGIHSLDDAKAKIQSIEANALREIERLSQLHMHVHSPHERPLRRFDTPKVNALLVFIRRSSGSPHDYQILMARMPKDGGRHHYFTLPMISTEVYLESFYEFVPLDKDKTAKYVMFAIADRIALDTNDIPQLKTCSSQTEWQNANVVFNAAQNHDARYGQTIRGYLNGIIANHLRTKHNDLYVRIMSNPSLP